jgi:hypothetical protein
MEWSQGEEFNVCLFSQETFPFVRNVIKSFYSLPSSCLCEYVKAGFFLFLGECGVTLKGLPHEMDLAFDDMYG